MKGDRRTERMSPRESRSVKLLPNDLCDLPSNLFQQSARFLQSPIARDGAFVSDRAQQVVDRALRKVLDGL